MQRYEWRCNSFEIHRQMSFEQSTIDYIAPRRHGSCRHGGVRFHEGRCKGKENRISVGKKYLEIEFKTGFLYEMIGIEECGTGPPKKITERPSRPKKVQRNTAYFRGCIGG